jgi:hypothetical protein
MTRFRFQLGGMAGCTICFLLCASCSRSVVHQRAFQWDKFPLPELSFTNSSVIEVVNAVNQAATIASKGAITQAVVLDTNPVPIAIITPDNAVIKDEMQKFVAAYRSAETNWHNRGANGFETYPYSGHFMARHSLGCSFRELTELTGLSYEERPDALHLGRMPAHLECRSYKVGEGLRQIAEEQQKSNSGKVGADPIASAFIEVSDSGLWSIQVPTGPFSSSGEFRYDEVFRFLPEKSVLLVIETPEVHEAATKALKARNMWEEAP